MYAYLQLISDPIQYTDAADYVTFPPFPAPSGFQWVEGIPDIHSVPYHPQSTLDKMKELVAGVPAEVRAQFAQAIAEVEVLITQADFDAARIVLQNLTLPTEYQSLGPALLGCLP